MSPAKTSPPTPYNPPKAQECASVPPEGESTRTLEELQEKAQAIAEEQERLQEELQRRDEQIEARVRERTAEFEEKISEIRAEVERLESANSGLRELAARLLQMQDEEKRRIARDLHDSTGQLLAVLCMNLNVLEAEVRKVNPQLADAMSESAAISRRISTDLRTISYLLYPSLLDEMGLISALRWHTEGFRQRTGIRVALEFSRQFQRLPRPLEILIFRAVQECLENVRAHSGSATAQIRVARAQDGVTVEVRDRGRGIEPQTLSQICSACGAGMGLRGLRERVQDFGGTMEITSRDKGTHITIGLPLSAAPSDDKGVAA